LLGGYSYVHPYLPVPGAGLGSDRGHLAPPHRFTNEQGRAKLLHPRHQRRDPRLVICFAPPLAARPHRDVQALLGDIYPHKHRARHGASSRPARRDPTLHDAGLRARPTVRTFDERWGRATPRLTDGLGDPRPHGLSPAPTCSHCGEESRYKAARLADPTYGTSFPRGNSPDIRHLAGLVVACT